MSKTIKRALCSMLALSMVVVLVAGCGTKKPQAKTGNYTYHSYSSALGNNWNPHTWETNADDLIQTYLTSPFCTMSIKDSENGVYQWVYEMATSITDVTKDHKDDLTKYAVTLPSGKTVEDVEDGYVFEIALNKNAKWENGQAITADDYIYSMEELLNPDMKNYRANLYYSGESAVAGGSLYYYNNDEGTYESVSSQGFASNQAALDAGKVLMVNVHDLWGMSAAGCVDKDGNPCPKWLAYNDTTLYRDASVAEGEDGDWVSGADIWAAVAAVADVGGSYADDVSIYVVNENYHKATYDQVGCYKVDDYTIRYVCQNHIDLNYFLTSCTSTWLVYKDLYEAGKDTNGTLTTTNYCTSMATSMSYGPYKLASLENDKQIVFVQNENWYGWEKDGDYLVSYTNFEVDGEVRQQYQATKIVIDVMDPAAAKQAFMKGELSEWTPEADDLVTYATSDQLYKVDETYTMSFFFNTNKEKLATMDASKGNKNSIVLSNVNFRKAMSEAIDRTEYVTATPGYKPAYSLLNNLYFYDVYNDPNSSYRSSDEAMQAICNLYGVEYGEGKAYKTLKEAYQSINGYNLTEAKELMKKACEELVAANEYKAGEDIVIRIGWKKGALDSSDNKCVALLNKYINAAVEGSGFGKVTFEAIDNINDRYSDVANGEFAIGYGAWGGAAFYPFRNFQVYCDTDQYSVNEIGCWDPAKEKLTINVNGEDVTMTWKDWSGALIGNGQFAEAGFDVKLHVLATMEEEFLQKYYRIPLCGMTACSMLAYQVSYYTDTYNIMYDFGGLRLLKFNYTDEEWTKYVADQGGTLSYE